MWHPNTKLEQELSQSEIDDVVRASIGEVEDYRRIEIQHLESLQVRGTVVADAEHIARGYDDIVGKLRGVGADLTAHP